MPSHDTNKSRLYKRLMRHTSFDGECLLWTSAKDKSGYGLIKIGPKTMQAHRVSHWLATGDWPDNLCHACDTPACIRPAHLRPCTHAENMAEKKERGRARNQHNVARPGQPNADTSVVE